jgi:hypothetical protein
LTGFPAEPSGNGRRGPAPEEWRERLIQIEQERGRRGPFVRALLCLLLLLALLVAFLYQHSQMAPLPEDHPSLRQE